MDINFDIDSALASAQCLRSQLPQICSSSENGLYRHDAPVWAGKDIQKLGIANAVLRKIGSGTFARRRPEDDKAYREYVGKQLAAGAPLQFRLGCGPLKNQQVCGGSQQPDCAEYLMFIQLARFVSAVAALYPHGVKVQMVPDDIRACHANLCQSSQVCTYIAGLQNMVQGLGFNDWLNVESGQQRLCREYNVSDYVEAAEDYLRSWQQREPEAYADKWQRAVENAAHNLFLPDWDDAAVTKEAEAAAWRYLVAHQSEVLSGLWSVDTQFPLRYGRHPQFYQLYTMKENQTQLPWQLKLPFPSDVSAVGIAA